MSVDIEADGAAPLVNSLLSVGAAAYLWTSDAHDRVGTFTVDIEPLPDAHPHPDTMRWWKSQPAEVRDAATRDAVPAAEAMTRLVVWVDGLPGRRTTFAAHPAGYDFTRVYTYLHRFVGHSPFSHSAFDIKTLAASLLGVPYRKVGKRQMGKRWPVDGRHTHVAVDDAVEQGDMLMQMLDEDHTRQQAATL